MGAFWLVAWTLIARRRPPAGRKQLDQRFEHQPLHDELTKRALIDVCHALPHAGVIGEGIETEEQVSRLRELDCDLGQGAYYSPPLPPDRMEELLARDAPLMGTNAG